MYKKWVVKVLLVTLTVMLFSGCSRFSHLPRPSEGISPSTGEQILTEHTTQVQPQQENKELPEKELYFFNEPANHPRSTSIKIHKKLRSLELYGDHRLIGRFKIGLGSHPEGDKEKEGDSRTPEGSYYICTVNTASKFTLFLGLSYPGIKDAEKGLNDNRISRATFERIKNAITRKQQPPWDTALGGAVGIHGGGNSSDWTLGCIALSDEDIKLLGKFAAMKTPVEILP